MPCDHSKISTVYCPECGKLVVQGEKGELIAYSKKQLRQHELNLERAIETEKLAAARPSKDQVDAWRIRWANRATKLGILVDQWRRWIKWMEAQR